MISAAAMLCVFTAADASLEVLEARNALSAYYTTLESVHVHFGIHRGHWRYYDWQRQGENFCYESIAHENDPIRIVSTYNGKGGQVLTYREGAVVCKLFHNLEDQIRDWVLPGDFIGARVNGTNKNLADLLVGGTYIGEEDVDGFACQHFQTPIYKAYSIGIQIQIDAFLDPTRAYLPRRLVFTPKDNPPLSWPQTFHLKSFQIVDDPVTKRKRWYPKHMELVTSGQSETSVRKFLVQELSINPTLHASVFSPMIPEGADVIDEVKKIRYVQGGKKAAQEVIAEVIEQAPDASPDSIRKAQEELQVDARPYSGFWTTVFTYGIGVIAVAALVAAAVLKSRD